MSRRTPVLVTATAAIAALALAGCVQGESSDGGAGGGGADTLSIDFATYNPLSLVIRDQGWLEDALAEQDVAVEWVQSLGSNKANEGLRAGTIDIGSTAGSAALLARANGAEIRSIDVYSQPEWSALVTTSDSDIAETADLAGGSVAATTGTDPYFFLLQSLADAGLEPGDVTIENLQHADGWTALQRGDVDAWSGLDPIMAGAEQDGAVLFERDVDRNTYGLLNVDERFAEAEPEIVQTVVDAYEHAREWALANPEETAEILSEVAGIDIEVATTVIAERGGLDIDPVPGDAQRGVLSTIAPFLVESGDVSSQEAVDEALETLLDPSFAEQADPGAIG